MPNDIGNSNLEAAGSWAKKYFLASQAVMESVLRPYDLANTQWYVLYLLAHDGALKQRDLTRSLEVERATLSAVISALVRKGLIEQLPDPADQRQKVLQITTAGRAFGRRSPTRSRSLWQWHSRASMTPTLRRHFAFSKTRPNGSSTTRKKERSYGNLSTVTGGTGLVGSRLLRRFVKADIDCRALVRPGKEVPEDATAIEGDILTPDSLPAAVEGVTAVIRAACR